MNRIVATLSLLMLLCVGCQMDKRFSQLRVGMTKAEVLGIVKKNPTHDTTKDGIETLKWEDGDHFATFKNGRLTGYGSD